MNTKIYSAMKKIFLLTIVFFKMSFVFGQTSADWSPWITADCYKGIKYKVANWGKVSGDYSDYYWGIMFQNTYSQPISFSYHFSVGNENPPTKYNYTVTYQIEPGGVYSNDGTKATAILFKSSSTNYKVSITDVCVGNCDSNYINCQGVPQNSVTNSSNSNSNSTNQNNAGGNFSNVNDEIRDLQRRQSIACGKMQQQGQPFNNRLCTEGLNGALPQNDSDIRKYLVQLRSQVKELESMNNSNTTTQQNDLTDYNNSKADLERELAEHNAGIQKQNEENSNKLNIWNNAIKAGVDAHNKGNYAEAKNQFLNAINNSTNESNRQNAQNYYDKSVDAEKDQTKIKAVGDLVQVGINGAFGIADAIKANKEHKERRDAEKKAWLLENRQKEHDEKITKETEEKLKFDELLKEAENGNFTAQYEIAKKYGKDDEKYTISLYFYKMAYTNPNKEISEEFLMGYTDKLQQVGRIGELHSILSNKDYVSKYPLIKLKSAFYNIFIGSYFFWPSFFEGSEVQNGINQLKELIDQKTDELPALLYSYMQVTGEYEKFGVPLNEKDGLKVLKETKNLNAKYYLGLIYLNGTSSIIKDEKKAKDFFYESLEINIKNAKKYLNNYNIDIRKYKTSFKYSIYSPRILSYIELAKLTESEKRDDGFSIPAKIFENFQNKYASLIPIDNIDYLSKYIPTLFVKRQLNIFIDGSLTRFGLPPFPKDGTIAIILVNYSLNKCKICEDQYNIIKQVGGTIFITIQVATDFDITTEQAEDLYYFEGGKKITETWSVHGSSMVVTKRQKISNDAVVYTNLKEFDVSKLNEKGILPALYFYKNDELKHVQTGFTDKNGIIDIIQKIK